MPGNRIRNGKRRRRASKGPGDDWSCTITILRSVPGAELFRTTPVTYDMSVKSEGCWKAQAPPSFVGQQTMTDAHHRSVVNPLFSIYGCFDTTAADAAPKPFAVKYSELFESDGRLVADTVPKQDMLGWVAQGPISDRTGEHLTATDKATTQLRNTGLILWSYTFV